jgi:hypothetical protein
LKGMRNEPRTTRHKEAFMLRSILRYMIAQTPPADKKNDGFARLNK